MRITIGKKPEGGRVYIDLKHLCEHFFTIGGTGQGKTGGLTENIAVSLNLHRISYISLDPSGFSSARLYAAVRGNCEYLSVDHPFSINPLRQPYRPEDITESVIESLNESMRLTVKDSVRVMSPNMRTLLNRAIPECIADGYPTLEAVMHRVARYREHPEARDGVVSRLAMLLNDSRMNRILCGDGTLDVAKLSQSRRPLICNLHKLNSLQMVVVGNLLMQSIKNFLNFGDHSQLQPLIVLADEAQNFIGGGKAPEVIMREGRKLQLGVYACTQSVVGFEQEVLRMLMNSTNLAAFTVAFQEAVTFGRELLVPASLIQSNQRYHFYVKTPEYRGLVQALRPPVIIPFPLPEPVPVTPVRKIPTAPSPAPTPVQTTKPITIKPMLKWFSIAPNPSWTTNLKETQAEASHAETALPPNGGDT